MTSGGWWEWAEEKGREKNVLTAWVRLFALLVRGGGDLFASSPVGGGGGALGGGRGGGRPRVSFAFALSQSDTHLCMHAPFSPCGR